jgi:hypothetical protein
MRRDLALIGALLTSGGVAVLVAAFLPALYPVWTGRGDPMTVIGQHRGTWQLANWLFAAGAGATLAGLGALTGVVDRRPADGAVPAAALVLMALASTLWLANLAFRLTVTVRVVDSAAVPDWYPHLAAWTGGLWAAAALAGALAMLGYGVTVRTSAILPAWTGWFAIGSGALMLGLFAVIRDVPPFLLYLAPTAFGVTALARAVAA